jgi:hypothetical protein
MIKFISTAPRLLNILALSSLVLLIAKILVLNDIKELFNGAYELGVVLEAVLASILASYIFYMVVVHLREFKDRKYIYPLFLGSSGIFVGKNRPDLSAGLRVDSPWISTHYPWWVDRVGNPWNVRSSHTPGFPH